jgi:nicotinate-nucleotide adenylyltransferase
MRKLCYGGSFNPIHHGHLICARSAAERAGFDHVVLIPTGQPPHKPNSANLAEPRHRVELCRQAVAGDPLFEVDEVELARSGPSYTIDTARKLAQRWGKRVSWLIGADMLQILPSWHEARTLIQEVDFVIMARPGRTLDFASLPPEFRRLEGSVVNTPLIEISATDIRERVRTGRPIEFLTPESVCRYIQNHGLYR